MIYKYKTDGSFVDLQHLAFSCGFGFGGNPYEREYPESAGSTLFFEIGTELHKWLYYANSGDVLKEAVELENTKELMLFLDLVKRGASSAEICRCLNYSGVDYFKDYGRLIPFGII